MNITFDYPRENTNIPYRVKQKHTKPIVAQKTTFLLGGLSRAADRFIAAGLTAIGYVSKALPVPSNDSMDLGKEYCDAGLCNPTYYTVGNLLLYLENLRKSGISRQEINENYVYILAGSCGPCRFGMYEYQYRNALEKAGYGDFRLIVFQSAGGLSQDIADDGIQVNVEFFRAIINGIILSDSLNTMKNKLRPYEEKEGQTQEVFEECVELICKTLEQKTPLASSKNPFVKWALKSTFGEYLIHFIDQSFSKEIQEISQRCLEKIGKIRLDYSRPKVVVKITGEFWAALTEGDGNYNMFDHLHKENCEIITEPVFNWGFYLIWLEKELQKEKYESFKKIKSQTKWVQWKRALQYYQSLFLLNLAERILRRNIQKFSKWMGGFLELGPRVEELAKTSDKYIHRLYEGGEGFLEIAKNIQYTQKRMAHMVLSIKPFGCMPSTISDSVQAKVVEDFNPMVFLPIETSGDGQINVLSRVQMALGEASEHMREELDEVLNKFGYTKKDWGDLKEKLPAGVSPFKKFPRISGYAMTFSHYLHRVMKKGIAT